MPITEAQNQMLNLLDGIPLGRMYLAAFKAQMRLQIYFTGRTHELMLEFGDRAQSAILKHGGKDQVLDGVSGHAVQSELLGLWGDTVMNWTAELQQVRREAGMIAFGVEAVFHDRLMLPALNKVQEAIASPVVEGIYAPQLRILLEVAEQYLYGDGATLSGRIWKIDREARDGINTVLLNGIQKGDSAWNIAKDLQQYLGAGEDCPRWTSTRLYGRTKSEIAKGDTTGLLRGDACDGSGVSYNALRLARTEIQKIHNLATDRMMVQQPWVEQEQIHLSAAHPEPDECDDLISGGQDGKGIYSVGEIELPVHPNCLCYKTAVLMDQSQFTGQLNGWLKGDQAWPEMDRYANDLGVDLSTSLAPATVNLAIWLFSDKLEEWLK